MACNEICQLLNDNICMNICALSLDPKSYQFSLTNDHCYLGDPDLQHPLVKLYKTEHLMIQKVKEYLLGFD
ncbi:hypothetical protein [Shewanella woodyi]|uniref:hypothetical protein n=1 Tax=Shewanella woodyi TaxID=60961 RepID=UPI00374926E8